MTTVPESRISLRNDSPVHGDGDFVLYWMIANRRTTWNFSLQRAVDWARDLKKPLVILEALRGGADGVLVTGCHLGDCHYLSGNERAIDNIKMAHSLIGLLGIEPERLRLEWISAAEGSRFAEVVAEFTEQVRGLGANPL